MKTDHIYNQTISITKARFRSTKQYPIEQPFADASMGPFNTFGFATLELTDSDGVTAENFCFGMIQDILENKLLPILMNGGDRPYGEVFNDMFWAIRNDGFRGNSATALGQLDHVVHALAATKAGQPLHRYWGADRDWAYVYASGGGANYTDDELRTEFTRFKEQGYTIMKMKVGKARGTELDDDVRRVTLAREILGPDFGIAVDANQTFDPKTALELAERLAPLNIAWYEEPVHSGALHEIKEVCDNSPIDVSFGESEKSSKVFPALLDTGIKHLQPIVGYQCGIREWFEGAKLAQDRGVMWSSGGFSQSNCQAIAACDESAYTEILNPIIESYEPWLSRCPEIKDGKFLLPSDPGCSVAFNWTKLIADDLVATDSTLNKEDVASHAFTVN